SPLGIVDAPIALSTSAQVEQLPSEQSNSWGVCLVEPTYEEPPFITSATRETIAHEHEMVVSVGHTFKALPEPAAAFVTHQGQEWLVSARGRSQLPAADTAEGRNIRRILKLS